MNEVNVESVNLGDEVGQGVEPRFHLAPIVLRRPIARELLHRVELHALRVVRYLFPLRPDRRVDAPAQVDKLRFRSMEREWADRGALVGVVRRNACTRKKIRGARRG